MNPSIVNSNRNSPNHKGLECKILPMIPNVNFETIRLKPEYRQAVANEFLTFLAFITAFFAAGMTEGIVCMVMTGVMTVLAVVIIYRICYIRSMEYIITGEQLIFRHGIFVHSTEYMELYRVIDYVQLKSFIQQLLDIKTITILSGDRTLPALNIIGVPDKLSIVTEIRRRVEYNKKRRGVYEITNRM